jgi:hypothetical protein
VAPLHWSWPGGHAPSSVPSWQLYRNAPSLSRPLILASSSGRAPRHSHAVVRLIAVIGPVLLRRWRRIDCSVRRPRASLPNLPSSSSLRWEFIPFSLILSQVPIGFCLPQIRTIEEYALYSSPNVDELVQNLMFLTSSRGWNDVVLCFRKHSGCRTSTAPPRSAAQPRPRPPLAAARRDPGHRVPRPRPPPAVAVTGEVDLAAACPVHRQPLCYLLSTASSVAPAASAPGHPHTGGSDRGSAPHLPPHFLLRPLGRRGRPWWAHSGIPCPARAGDYFFSLFPLSLGRGSL